MRTDTTSSREPTGRVLLVDDEPEIRRDYSRLLRSLGCAVETAEDGAAAIEKLHVASFDLIISDIGMPRLTGTKFLRAIRDRDLDVPVILMTGAPDFDTAVEAVELSAFRYLTKPVSLNTLTQVVRRAIHMHQLSRLKRESLVLVGAEARQLDDRGCLSTCFTSALDNLWMAFQPIVDWSGRTVFAYEALLRSDEPTLRSPPDILDAAERLGKLHELGRRVRESVALSAPSAPDDALLFVNLHAADLNDPELVSASAPLTGIAERVVLEITERASLHGVHDLGKRIRRLRDLGFRIAVDDLGAGYAGLSSFAQLEPEFVKLDMSLVRGVDVSPRKRSVIRAMTHLCAKDLTIEVISEGVETIQERDVLAQEGCNFLQGYLFAKPARGFPVPQW
ncbi:MAG: EAL domain-containing protein [Polyangiales bacterium]